MLLHTVVWLNEADVRVRRWCAYKSHELIHVLEKGPTYEEYNVPSHNVSFRVVLAKWCVGRGMPRYSVSRHVCYKILEMMCASCYTLLACRLCSICWSLLRGPMRFLHAIYDSSHQHKHGGKRRTYHSTSKFCLFTWKFIISKRFRSNFLVIWQPRIEISS